MGLDRVASYCFLPPAVARILGGIGIRSRGIRSVSSRWPPNRGDFGVVQLTGRELDRPYLQSPVWRRSGKQRGALASLPGVIA